MTPLSCGLSGRNAQDIHSCTFYVASLARLTAEQKIIVLLVADCYERGPPFQPKLAALAKLCSCSRKTVWRALQGLEGHHGWIVNEWRGGQKTNCYRPGWRLVRILHRFRTRRNRP